MALKNKTIAIANKGTDAIHLDQSKAEGYKKILQTDYNNLVNDLNNIANAYKKLYKDSDSKGVLKTNFQTIYNKSKKRAEYATSKKNSLNSQLTKDIQNYAMQMLGNRIAQLEAQIAKLLGNN